MALPTYEQLESKCLALFYSNGKDTDAVFNYIEQLKAETLPEDEHKLIELLDRAGMRPDGTLKGMDFKL